MLHKYSVCFNFALTSKVKRNIMFLLCTVLMKKKFNQVTPSKYMYTCTLCICICNIMRQTMTGPPLCTRNVLCNLACGGLFFCGVKVFFETFPLSSLRFFIFFLYSPLPIIFTLNLF